MEILKTLTFLALTAFCKAKTLPKNAIQSQDRSKLAWPSFQGRSSYEWGEWTPFGPCSRTCGGGVQYRFRVCHGGKTLVPRSRCHGSSFSSKSCKAEPCSVKTAPPFPEIPMTPNTELQTPMPPDPLPPSPELPLTPKTDLLTPMSPDPLPPFPEIPFTPKTDLLTPIPPDPLPPFPEIPLTPKTDLQTPIPPDSLPPFPELPFTPKTDLLTPIPPDPLPPFPEIPFTPKTDLLTPIPPDSLPPFPEIPFTPKTDLLTPIPPDPLPPFPEIPFTPKTDLLTPIPPDSLPPFPEIPLTPTTDLLTPIPPDPLPPFPEIPLTPKTDLLTPIPPDPLPPFPEIELTPKTSPPMSIWTEWGAYGPCSKTCGEGIRYRRRHCLSSHSWKDTCYGPAYDGVSCKSMDCKENECKDLIRSNLCKKFAKQGKCKNESGSWMLELCRKSCDSCNEDIIPSLAKLSKKNAYDSCGQPLKNRIIGGENASLGDWPWQVAIAFKSNPKIVLCGGTLISDQWVLTASHCFLSKYKKNPANIVVRMGETELQYQENGKANDVAQLVRHEDFDRETFDNDIALLKLVRPVEFNMLVLPACLPSQFKNVVVGKECYITGWGNMAPNTFGSIVLQEAKIPIAEKDICRKQFSKLNIDITENMICSGGGDKDACQGDSGGPLVCKENGKYELTGIISFGRGCGNSDYHGIYTKVSNYIHWIEDHTQKPDDV